MINKVCNNKPLTVLITGASGLLGCRLTEMMHYSGNYKIIAMVHRSGKAWRLSRLPIEIVSGDLLDKEFVARNVKKCDVIVHCAYGNAGPQKLQKKVTVIGTKLLIEAALQYKIKAFIYISTVAVYSYDPPPNITEDSSTIKSTDIYSNNKIAAENLVYKYIKRFNLPATILRLGHLWGPYSSPWVARPIELIKNGFVSLVDDGEHFSNALFIDNAVEAILKAIHNIESISGEKFFITDDPFSWCSLFINYSKWLNGVPLISILKDQLNELNNISFYRKYKLVKEDIFEIISTDEFKKVLFNSLEMPYLGSSMIKLWSKMSVMKQGKIKHVILDDSSIIDENTYKYPPLDLLRRFGSKTEFSNAKAKELMDFNPRVDFDEAIVRTNQWAKWARLI